MQHVCCSLLTVGVGDGGGLFLCMYVVRYSQLGLVMVVGSFYVCMLFATLTVGAGDGGRLFDSDVVQRNSQFARRHLGNLATIK